MPSTVFRKLNNTIPLSPADTDRIDGALQYLEISQSDRQILIDDIARTGAFRHFGYGSLINDPASETDTQYGGTADGWKKGPFCKDRAFRGRFNSLGVTMGAITAEGRSALQGVINEIRAKPDENFVDRIVKNIQEFALRETGLNPIYVYKLVDVQTPKKGTVKALICAADPENKLYLGANDATLSLEQKAAIIATSSGGKDNNGSFISNPRYTGMAYWRDHIYCCKTGGFEPDPDIKRLVELAEVFRDRLKNEDPKLYNWLNTIEGRQKPANARPGVTYATPVYDIAKIRPPETNEKLKPFVQKAKSKAGLHSDPLTPTEVGGIRGTITELKQRLV